ncbi:MAG TPA: sigma-70 family RNA polymerase sigma factor [Anaeromyxobacteraceae bacterium]|nr:sigma-70 family RNA polymerase sigma factor [Anaeromyxobacteraceae bacterium]
MGQGRAGEASFGREALSHLDALYRFARRLTGEEADAEDLVQETFTRALGAAERFEPGTDLRAWMFRILRNLNLDRRRRDRRHPTVAAAPLEELPAGAPSAGDAEVEALRGVVARDLERAMAALPEEWRALVLLRLEGLGDREMAEVMGCPPGTVKSRLARARAALRQALRPYARRAAP